MCVLGHPTGPAKILSFKKIGTFLKLFSCWLTLFGSYHFSLQNSSTDETQQADILANYWSPPEIRIFVKEIICVIFVPHYDIVWL